MKKVQITQKQAAQFNHMRGVLQAISKAYAKPGQLKKNCGKHYGLDYEETLEMSYENMQFDAARAVKGIKALVIS